jgi:hypothetical protein
MTRAALTSHVDSSPERTERLLGRVKRAVRRRGLSRRTETVFVEWIGRFVLYHGRRHPARLGARHVDEFLRALDAAGVPADVHHDAARALRFLYSDVLVRPPKREARTGPSEPTVPRPGVTRPEPLTAGTTATPWFIALARRVRSRLRLLLKRLSGAEACD